ncbi:hypothetical protein ASH03_10335, partial [Rhodococcus sp. Leaf258]
MRTSVDSALLDSGLSHVYRLIAGGAAMNDNTVRRVRASDRVLPHPPRRLPVVGDILDLHVTESSQWAMRDAQKYGSIYERNVDAQKYGSIYERNV